LNSRSRRCGSEAAPGPPGVHQLPTGVVAKHDGVETPGGRSVAGDYERLPAVAAHLLPGAERWPGSYRLSRRFATKPSNPFAFTDWIRSGRLASSAGDSWIGSSNSARNLCCCARGAFFDTNRQLSSRPWHFPSRRPTRSWMAWVYSAGVTEAAKGDCIDRPQRNGGTENAAP